MCRTLRSLLFLVLGLALVSPIVFAQDLVILDCAKGAYLGVAGQFDCAAAKGGTTAYSIIAAPSVLNPITAQDTASNSIGDHVFGGGSFTTYDLLAGDATGTVPQVASVIEVAQDGKSVTYTIRDGLKFSDGSAATVDDIMYWYNDVVYNPNLPNSTTSAFSCTDGTPFTYTAIASNKLKISCSEAYRTFVGTAGGAFVLSKGMALDLIGAQGIATEPGVNGLRAKAEFLGLGAPIDKFRAIGPYILTQFSSQSGASYARNPNFYEVDSNGTRLPYLDNLQVIIIPTAGQNLALNQFLGGQVEVLAPRPSDIAPILGQTAAGGFQINSDIDNAATAGGTNFVAINFEDENPGLAAAARNVSVRHALSLAIDRVAIVNNVLLGIGSPQYVHADLATAGVFGAQFFVGRNNTCVTFASFAAPCSKNNAGAEVLTVRSGLQIQVVNLPPPGLTQESDEQLKCLVDYQACINDANALLDAAGLKDTDNNGTRNLPNGQDWNVQVVTNSGNTIREGYTQTICDGWKQLHINCSANSIAFATLVTQLLGGATWSGGIVIGLTGGDPAGSVNVDKCGAPLYFWNLSCSPEATSGPAVQDSASAAIEKAFDQGFAATTVADAQAGFDKFQAAFFQGEPFILLAQQNALFATRTDRLCNDNRASNAFDDVKYRVDIAANAGTCTANIGR
ncbi:hypothetical protein HY229_00610 [Candidatus Acetothermia bacterium]|nr:hypothetical protein [Candidatus Acetothermia bacterium]MBI3642592.1 hypothetical protein [Candidatus Acetothermia bacterium]